MFFHHNRNYLKFDIAKKIAENGINSVDIYQGIYFIAAVLNCRFREKHQLPCQILRLVICVNTYSKFLIKLRLKFRLFQKHMCLISFFHDRFLAVKKLVFFLNKFRV